MGKKKNSKNQSGAPQGVNADAGNVFHSDPPKKGYNIYDSDIASDNLTNDIPSADMQDMI